jgi:regulator of cell morphogenesis and NO signaling
MQNFRTRTIREIAVAEPATTRVFEEFKIDFCCGGGFKFGDACRKAGVDPDIVSRRLDQILQAAQDSEPAENETASELIDHIVGKHHAFSRSEITRLSPLMEKVAGKHGEAHPELFELKEEFSRLCADMMPHMQKEETVLFPFIKHLEIAAANDLSVPHPAFQTVKNPIRMLMTEHDTDGALLRKMRGIANDYAVPENVCPSFRALYFGLEELEKDLHRHIHLENDVLFPEAVKLEQKVMPGY